MGKLSGSMNDLTGTNQYTIEAGDAGNPRTHLIIPDTQVKPGVPTDHLGWIGQYIVDRKPDVIVHLGDHADMESLSSYDAGKASYEGRRYVADIDAANAGFSVLCEPLQAYNAQKRHDKHAQYLPARHITLGNHEHRITRAADSDPKLVGFMKLEHLEYAGHGYQVHDFLQPVCIDGIWYTHFWANPMTGRPYGGNAASRLKQIGHTFVMGHQQTLDYAVRFLPGTGAQQFGLIAGACYLHDEDYKGPQGNAHWRGVIMLHEVDGDGAADPMFVSLDYLCRRYEGVRLSKFTARKF
jgi:hypothetical protein